MESLYFKEADLSYKDFIEIKALVHDKVKQIFQNRIKQKQNKKIRFAKLSFFFTIYIYIHLKELQILFSCLFSFDKCCIVFNIYIYTTQGVKTKGT